MTAPDLLPTYVPSELDLADEHLGNLDYLGATAETWWDGDEPDLDEDDDDGWCDAQDRYEAQLDRWGGAA